MSREELKQILTDLQFYADPECSQDEFRAEIVEGLIENVLDGKMLIRYRNGEVSYSLTDEGKEYVENMGQ